MKKKQNPDILKALGAAAFILIILIIIFLPGMFPARKNTVITENESYSVRLADIESRNWETRSFNITDYDYNLMDHANLTFSSAGHGNFSLYINKRIVFNGNLSSDNNIYLEKSRIMSGENTLYFYSGEETMTLKGIGIRYIKK
jgi:hypothetical protein